jgi:hypothetical protein
MRPIFGMLLIGGGLLLIIGEFAGKITFPLNFSAPQMSATTKGTTKP